MFSTVLINPNPRLDEVACDAEAASGRSGNRIAIVSTLTLEIDRDSIPSPRFLRALGLTMVSALTLGEKRAVSREGGMLWKNGDQIRTQREIWV